MPFAGTNKKGAGSWESCALVSDQLLLAAQRSAHGLHGSITEAVAVFKWSAINLSTSSSISSPFTTQAFSVSTSPFFNSAAGSRKIFQGEPHLRVSPVDCRYA